MYLRHIDARMFGLWLASGGVIAWLGLLDLGIAGVMGQRIAAAYGRQDYQDIGLYYFNGQLFQGLAMILLVFVSAVVARVLPVVLGAAPTEQTTLSLAIFLSAVSTALTFLNNGQQNAANALQRPLIPMANAIGGRLLAVAMTVGLLGRGKGLVALPLGLLFGAAFVFVLNFLYVTRVVRQFPSPLRWDRRVFTDILRLSPAIFAGKTGNALVSQIEPTLIALMIAPEAAIAFSVTKRAADTIQNIVDRLVGSVTAGFSHLYAGSEANRAAQVADTIFAVCLGAAVVCLSCYVMLNHGFTRLWVGERYFAGNAVTALVALSAASLVMGNLFTMLLGSTGDIATPNVAVLIEAGLRLLMMAVFLWWFGMKGLPLATLITSGAMAAWLWYRLRSRLLSPSILQLSRNQVVAIISVMLASIVVSKRFSAEGWFSLVLVGLATVAIVGSLLLVLSKPLRNTLSHAIARR